MRKIDDYLMDLLRANNFHWLKKMIGFGKLEVEASAFIGTKRNSDLLVTILNYPKKTRQKVAVEVENDRAFDVDGVLRKIKKDQRCPTIVIIPREHEKSAWRFQESLIIVWFWDVRCRWRCSHLKCNRVFRTTSSKQPDKCPFCRKGGCIEFEDIEHGGEPFLEASNNPAMSWSEIQEKLRPKGFFLSVR